MWVPALSSFIRRSGKHAKRWDGRSARVRSTDPEPPRAERTVHLQRGGPRFLDIRESRFSLRGQVHMKKFALHSQFGALCVAGLVLVAGRIESRAQAATEASPVVPAGPGDLSQAE